MQLATVQGVVPKFEIKCTKNIQNCDNIMILKGRK